MNYKAERKKKGLSQEQVAIAAGIAIYTYQKIETGATKNPHSDNLRAIMKVLEPTEKEAAQA